MISFDSRSPEITTLATAQITVDMTLSIYNAATAASTAAVARDEDSSPWTRTRVGLESRYSWTRTRTRTRVPHVWTRTRTSDVAATAASTAAVAATSEVARRQAAEQARSSLREARLAARHSLSNQGPAARGRRVTERDGIS